MFFKYRPARLSDLVSYAPSARDAFAYNEADRALSVKMWQDLLAKGQAHCPVIDDCTLGATGGCAFTCFLVFVDDAFAQRMATEAPPLSSKYLLHLWGQGKAPFLSARQIQVANSTEGLNMVVLTSGVSQEMIRSGNLLLMGSKVVEYNPYALNGLRLKRVFIEMYDEVTYNWAETFGYFRLTDYPKHFADKPEPPEGQRPVLFGIDAEQAAKKIGAGVTVIFQYQTPRFDFRAVEQEMLLWALSGDTDEQLCANLNVSFETVKKRWRTIYTRVQNVAPEIFEESNPIGDHSRGSEKKRNLLGYLRHHMEELRPYDPKLLSRTR